MIRIKLRGMLDDKCFKERRKISLNELSEITGISRTTINRISNQPGYNATLDAVDALCRYFGCTPGELLEYVQDDDGDE